MVSAHANLVAVMNATPVAEPVPVAGVPVDTPALLLADHDLAPYLFKRRFSRMVFSDVLFTRVEAQLCFHRLLEFSAPSITISNADYYMFRHISTRGINVDRDATLTLDANSHDRYVIKDIAKHMCKQYLLQSQADLSNESRPVQDDLSDDDDE